MHRKELRIEGTMKASNHRSTPINPCLAILVALVVVAASSLERPSHGEPSNEEHQRFPCHETEISHYTAYRTGESIRIDGQLEEASWKTVPRSPRFVDLISGSPTIHDTRAAVL